MPLKIVKRKSTGAWTISGTIAGIRIQKRASTNNRRLAEEEAAALETELLRAQFYGPKRGTKTFGETVLSYADAVPRTAGTYKRLARLVDVIGANTPLAAIDQDAVIRARDRMLKPGASPSTYRREVITPLNAVLNFAAKQDWLDRVPQFVIPKLPQGRTRFLLPADAERLITVAAPHLRSLLVFLIGTGARMSEALELEWPDVDFEGRRVTFWKTKTGRSRVAELPPRVIAALAELPHRDGPVFLTHKGQPYWSSGRYAGGQIKTAWKGALRRAGLDPGLRPHDLRHSFATWFYALHKDLLALKLAGGWSSVAMVEKYAHLAPRGQQQAIREFLGLGCDRGATAVARPPPFVTSSD